MAQQGEWGLDQSPPEPEERQRRKTWAASAAGGQAQSRLTRMPRGDWATHAATTAACPLLSPEYPSQPPRPRHTAGLGGEAAGLAQALGVTLAGGNTGGFVPEAGRGSPPPGPRQGPAHRKS